MKKLISVILVILWMIVIFTFSSAPSNKSKKTSGRIVKQVVNVVGSINNKRITDKNTLDKIELVIRKLAHVSEYLMLGILVYNLVMVFNLKDPFLIALLLCILYSISDEIHQLFVPSRSGMVIDVLIDTIGIYIGIFLCSKFYNKYIKS